MPIRKKFITLAAASFACVMFLTVGALTAAEVPEEIVIENPGYENDKFGPADFHHKKHSEEYKIGCTECHHEYKDGKNIWKECDQVKKCNECHKAELKKGGLEDAYHDNCRKCHRDLVKAGKMDKKMGSCNFCHKRNKK